MRYLCLILGTIFSLATFAAPVQEYRLNNGLKLLVQEDHRAPVACFQIWYKIGGGYESNGKTGISHAIEHMLFKSTKNYPLGEFTRLITADGGIRNAAIAVDYTYFYETVAANKLPLVFTLEAERMQNALFKADEFKNELQIIMEERRFRTDNKPSKILLERLKAAAFLASPYQHPNIGWMNDILHLNPAETKAWYKTWYVPNNATIVIAGDVKPQQMYAYAEQYFGQIPAKKLPYTGLVKDVPVLGPKQVVINIPAKRSELVMAYNVPVAATAKPAWEAYALLILDKLLTGSSHTRLKDHLIYQYKLANHIETSYCPFQFRMDNLFYITVIPAKNSKLNDLIKAIEAELSYYQTKLVSAEELKKVKTRLIAENLYEIDSLTARAKQLGMFETVGLSWKDADNYEKNIQQVTSEQIRLVTQRYLTSARVNSGKLIPRNSK